MLDKKSPQICIIGAGMGGLCAAIQLRKKLNIQSFTIYDENADVGGTWLVNTYSGCACDVSSHLYSFSFEKNPNWSKQYPDQAEILEYIRNVTTKYGLHEKIKFQHRVKTLRWDEMERKWIVSVLNLVNKLEVTLKFDIVISAVGVLRVPNYPAPFETFKGIKMHTANWNSEVNLDDKIVAVVGTGASAVQVIPAIVDKVKELIVYQRRPAWIFPRVQFKYSDCVKKCFEKVPGTQWAWRCFLFWWFEYTYWAFRPNNIIRMGFSIITKGFFKHQVKDPILRAKLTPNYELGCKRVSLSTEYYPALSKPNVTIINSPIKLVTENAIVNEDGTILKPDVLILATGFKATDYFFPMQITGKGGEDLFTKWKEQGPSTYLGIICQSAPNLFFICGPNTSPGHNSQLFFTECQVNWAIQVVKQMIQRNARKVTVKLQVEEEYMRNLQSSFEGTVWISNCASWYKDERGVVTSLWPKSLISYYFSTRCVNTSKLEFS